MRSYKEGVYTRRYMAFVLALICVSGLVGCNADKHICRPLRYREILDLQTSSLTEPFVTDEERDELLNKAVRKYLNSIDEKSVSFTYEIIGTHLGVCENKETILYWVKIVYGNGFTTALGFIIQ